MIDSSAIITSEQRVDMERRNNVRSALRYLTADYQQFTRDQVRAHVVAVMLASVEKQARWSAGLEPASG